MSSRPMKAPFPVILNGDMSGTVTSLVTVLQNMSMLSYDISWSGTGTMGTFDVQVSNSYSENADGTVRNPGNWTSLPLSHPTIVATDSGFGFIDIEALGAFAARLVYTPTAGTGLLQAILIGKVG
jgi:hypothetical protein